MQVLNRVAEHAGSEPRFAAQHARRAAPLARAAAATPLQLLSVQLLRERFATPLQDLDSLAGAAWPGAQARLIAEALPEQAQLRPAKKHPRSVMEAVEQQPQLNKRTAPGSAVAGRALDKAATQLPAANS